jgi:hypothetical protein
MGADWYSTTVLYGCSVKIPSGSTHAKLLSCLEKILQGTGFEVQCLLADIHSRMEGMNEREHNEMTEYSDIVVGFHPSEDLSALMERAEKLKILLAGEVFAKYTTESPTFHAGVQWYPLDEDSDDDDDTEEDEQMNSNTAAKTLTAEEIHKMFYA